MKMEGKYLVIRLKAKKPRLSKSGKTMLVASTRGVKKSSVMLSGKPLRYIANVFIDLDKKETPRPKK
jgi:hypothetical protein